MKKGEISAQCSFIVMNYAFLNSQCISNSNNLFSETVPPKKHGQVNFDKKGYQDALLVLFTATTLAITTDTQTGERIYSPKPNTRKGFSTKLCS